MDDFSEQPHRPSRYHKKLPQVTRGQGYTCGTYILVQYNQFYPSLVYQLLYNINKARLGVLNRISRCFLVDIK